MTANDEALVLEDGNCLPLTFRIAEAQVIEFLQLGRITKVHRIPKVELMFCRQHFGNAMLCVVTVFCQTCVPLIGDV